MATNPTPPPKKPGRTGHYARRIARNGQFRSMHSAKGDALPPGVLGHTRLKKSGGSLIATVPASARDTLHLHEGQEMAVMVEGETLVLKPAVQRPKYTLEELLAQCDFDAPYSDEERAWLDAEPVGRELL